MTEAASLSPARNAGTSGARGLRIAYIGTDDPADPHAWSGLVHGILRALQMTGASVTIHGGIKEPRLARYITAFKKILYSKLTNKRYQRVRDPILAAALGRKIEKLIAGKEYDILFFYSSLPPSRLRTRIPMVFWADATFGGMVEYYPSYFNLSRETLTDGHRLEQSAIDRSALALYASSWAADSAKHFYSAGAKARVLRFGANVPDRPTREELPAILARRRGGPVRLLMIGVDWIRKGGPKALAVTEELRRRGVDAELHVVGCTPPASVPGFVVSHGFLRKNNPTQWAGLRDLLETCHFNILPSVAECYGLVLVEAAAFGLPTVASNSGGMTSAVIAGATGFSFEVDAPATAYVDTLLPLINDPDRYQALCESAFSTYQETLSWEASAVELGDLLRQIADGKRVD